MPGTLVIKALTALVGGWLYHRMAGHAGLRTPVRVAIAGIPAEIIMVVGYFIYEAGMQIVAGSAAGAAAAAVLAGVPFNIVQGLPASLWAPCCCPYSATRATRWMCASKPDPSHNTLHNFPMKHEKGAVSQRLFFHARIRCKTVKQEAAAGLGVAGVLLKKIPGAAKLKFFSQRGAHDKAGEGHTAAVKCFDHADVA